MQSHKDMKCETRSNESLNGIVLLVDDDPLMRFLTRQTLEQCGLLVEEAENGRQALDLYEKTPPDIVLMDVMMPLMDGFEACRLLRESRRDCAPVIMLTGLEDADSIAQWWGC